MAYVNTNSNWSNSNEKELFLTLKNGTYTGALNHDATGNITVTIDDNSIWEGSMNSANNSNTAADTVVVNGTWIMDAASYPDVLIINSGAKVYTNGYTLSYSKITNNGTLDNTSTNVTAIDAVEADANASKGFDKIYSIDGKLLDKQPESGPSCALDTVLLLFITTTSPLTKMGRYTIGVRQNAKWDARTMARIPF